MLHPIARWTYVQTSRLDPHVFVLRTLIAPGFDEFPRCDHPICVLFKSCSGDPSWGVLRIRLDERVEEHARSLDIADFCLRFQNDAVQGSEVALRVYRRGRPAEVGCSTRGLATIQTKCAHVNCMRT
jgi:hypothetical protein